MWSTLENEQSVDLTWYPLLQKPLTQKHKNINTQKEEDNNHTKAHRDCTLVQSVDWT